MVEKVATLVKEITTAGFAGTGPVQLAGQPSGQLWAIKFANGIGDGNSCEYVVRGDSEWERVIGTLTAGSPDTLSRDTVIENHLGTTAKIGFTAGVKDVYLVGPLDTGRAHGQCRLGLEGANLVLRPFDGNKVIANGILRTIPDAGISLAPTGLAVDTTYFIYLYDDAGTLKLEASTTGHARDATTGVEIKTGDATRALVGVWPTVAGPAWSTAGGTSWFNAGVVQVQSYQDAAVATGTTTIPFDDTIPQNTEGDEYMTLAFTPKFSASTLIIEVTALLANTLAGNLMTLALFQDAIADALAAAYNRDGAADGPMTVAFSHSMSPGTTSTITFKVRVGGKDAGTTTFNGQSGARRYGGKAASSIVITEVLP